MSTPHHPIPRRVLAHVLSLTGALMIAGGLLLVCLAFGLCLLAPVAAMLSPLGWWFIGGLATGLLVFISGFAVIQTGRNLRCPRVLPGQCRTCGYDLRAADLTRPCPECGTLP